VVDLAMRRWLNQDQPEPGWMLAHVDALLDEAEEQAKATGDGVVKWKHPKDQAEVREFCRELVTRLEVILAERCLPFDWQEAVRFSVPVTIPDLASQPREILLVGEIDLLVRPAGVGIWDLKGTKDDSYWRKVVGQLLFYEIAWVAKTGEWPEVSGLIQPMCKQPVLEFHFSDDERRQMMSRIVAAARDIWSGNMPPKESPEGCNYCPVQHACPKYKVAGGHGRTSLLSVA
jgi:hypothetical protein